MNEFSWLMVVIIFLIVGTFSYLSIQSVASTITELSSKSDDWREIVVQVNVALDKAIIIQKEQYKIDHPIDNGEK